MYVLLRVIFSSCYKIFVGKGVWTSAANNRNVFVLQVRDRPFNLQGWGGGMVFFSFKNIFFRTTRVRIFFYSKFNIRLYDKYSESDFYFPPPKSEYFFRKKS